MATIDSRVSHGGTPPEGTSQPGSTQPGSTQPGSTQPGSTQPGSGDPPAGGTGRSRHHWSWRRWTLLALGALVTTAVVVLALLAWTYQPVQFGDAGGGAFPGLPAGTGLRTVNNFNGETGQTYIPPQRGVFTLTESIQNTGPQTVTILAVSILSPQQQTSGIGPWPLTPAGTVRWMTPSYENPHLSSVVGSFATSVSLTSGDFMYVGIPLRQSGSCYLPGSSTGGDAFYVKERFGIFTRWVAVQVQLPWTMQEPFDPGNGSSYPASEPPHAPAQELVCPAKS